jgi:hypothetical protein
MKPINVRTKISYLLKESPGALEAIISISPKFNKLRNPILRKLMASRTSIANACKIGGCQVNDFFEKLKPLGFEIDETVAPETQEKAPRPEFMDHISAENLAVLDVRAMLDAGKDPFKLIMEKINNLKEKQVLQLINSFEPTPLIQILEKKNFQTYVEAIDPNLVHTYFFNPKGVELASATTTNTQEDWALKLKKIGDNLATIDVRQLEAPLPMLTILDELEKLGPEKALYVYHKRIPVFLLPELREKNYDYLIKEISDGEVHLLIFHQ